MAILKYVPIEEIPGLETLADDILKKGGEKVLEAIRTTNFQIQIEITPFETVMGYHNKRDTPDWYDLFVKQGRVHGYDFSGHAVKDGTCLGDNSVMFIIDVPEKGRYGFTLDFNKPGFSSRIEKKS